MRFPGDERENNPFNLRDFETDPSAGDHPIAEPENMKPEIRRSRLGSFAGAVAIGVICGYSAASIESSPLIRIGIAAGVATVITPVVYLWLRRSSPPSAKI